MKLTPNALSLLRMAIAFGVPFLLGSGGGEARVLGAAALYAFGAVTDVLDGLWARRRSLVTNLGKILDPTADKCLVLGAYAAFIWQGVLSAWWVLPIFLREVAVTGVRSMRLWSGKKVPASTAWGKSKTFFQHVSVFAAFSVLLLRPSQGPVGGFLMRLAPPESWHRVFTGTFLLAVFFTITSGIEFFVHLRPAQIQARGSSA